MAEGIIAQHRANDTRHDHCAGTTARALDGDQMITCAPLLVKRPSRPYPLRPCRRCGGSAYYPFSPSTPRPHTLGMARVAMQAAQQRPAMAKIIQLPESCGAVARRMSRKTSVNAASSKVVLQLPNLDRAAETQPNSTNILPNSTNIDHALAKR